MKTQLEKKHDNAKTAIEELREEILNRFFSEKDSLQKALSILEKEGIDDGRSIYLNYYMGEIDEEEMQYFKVVDSEVITNLSSQLKCMVNEIKNEDDGMELMEQFEMLIDEDWYKDNKELLHTEYDELYDMEQLRESYKEITKLYEELRYMVLI